MATVVLSAAGAAIGGSIGGTVAGLSSVAIGRVVGATLGKVIDQRLMGQGSDVVEHGKIDRFRLSSSGEGEAVSQVYGRMRVGGQIIWASQFTETTTVSGSGGGGKGAPSQPETREYSYSVSLALALCEGEIAHVGRVWADGEEVAPDDLNMRVYLGTDDQLPDPTMEAIEEPGTVPAYRGTAYVVMEDLQLGPFGNRVPQFSFEVIRPERPEEEGAGDDLARGLNAVALMPGTGEYALATTPVHYTDGQAGRWSANVNSPAQKADFAQSLESLTGELPNCEAASLIVSWFGNDLRCGSCEIKPKVERREYEGANMPWRVSGLSRSNAEEIAQVDDRPIYGGTPADAAVIEAIKAMNAAGQAVMFYPFILMDQQEGNTLPDPYSDGIGQAPLPWRGRITTSKAPGQTGSPDGTAAARAEVDAFFGSATASDFQMGSGVIYSGPSEWSFSRFILHYAALCAAAGGVESFCIGSELRGLTQIRAESNRFFFVERLIALAAEVRAIMGPETKISYAADWSEYFGYQPQDGSGDRYFHLDPLWADDNIDFIGIDNYMPLSDWRDVEGHRDADWGEIYNLDYLRANIEGGEGYDWYYHSVDAEAAQIRTPITDDEFGEPWIWRYKDIRNWWDNYHYERIAGTRQAEPTAWEPGSKPIWFTEFGCAAVDKGTNQPNKFLDPKSSESSLPKHSNGGRDDLIQKQYYCAMLSYWRDPSNNPVSELYDGPMIDMSRAFAWAWDTRPYPFFPNNTGLWSDGENYSRGHWINGRTSSRTLASVVSEICDRAGVVHYDVSHLYGVVRGFQIADVSDARAAIQPLMLRFAFDAVERDGTLMFVMRDKGQPQHIAFEDLAMSEDVDGSYEFSREAEAELAGRVRVRFAQADADFETVAEETVLADESTHAVSTSDVPLALTRTEGRQLTERWLAEARISRDTVKFALPPSKLDIRAGDTITIDADQAVEAGTFRIDRMENGPFQIVEAVRMDQSIYEPANLSDELPPVNTFVPPLPLTSLFLDLPLMTGDEVPHAPHLAVAGSPWPGGAAVYRSSTGDGFTLNGTITAPSVIGITRSVLQPAISGRFDRGAALEVELVRGELASVSEEALLSGENLAAIGSGEPNAWELFQFQAVDLVGPRRYRLSGRLRGQLGTEFAASLPWPENSWFVLINGAPKQINLASNLRRVEQTYRIGPSNRGYADPSYTEELHAFDGNGLRPYSPAHLTARRAGSGDVDLTWVRRTRIDGDGWETPEVPLGEDAEEYVVRVLSQNAIVREEIINQRSWTYSAALQSIDGISASFVVGVAQISARFGPGIAASTTVAGV